MTNVTKMVKIGDIVKISVILCERCGKPAGANESLCRKCQGGY